MGQVFSSKWWSCCRNPERAYLSRYASRLHSYWPCGAFSLIWKLLGYYSYNDGAVQQVHENGEVCVNLFGTRLLTALCVGPWNKMEDGSKQYKLPRNQHLGPSRTQRLFSSKSIFYWCSFEPQGTISTCIFAARRELLFVYYGPLPSIKGDFI